MVDIYLYTLVTILCIICDVQPHKSPQLNKLVAMTSCKGHVGLLSKIPIPKLYLN